jgi:hypothetical protein
MCHAVQCRICGTTTWSGYGLHVNPVKRTVHPTTGVTDTATTSLRLHAGSLQKVKARR